jgi:rod shape determining protein RodA
MMNRMPRQYDLTIGQKLMRVHWLSLFVMTLIVSVGLTSLYSVVSGSFSPWAERHVVRFLAGIGLILLMAVTPREIWLRLAYPTYLLALLLLAAVMLVGIEAGGAKRWLSFGGVRFQPSEFMKIGLIVALARYYQWCGVQRVSQPSNLVVPIGLILAPVALMVLQPDLGTAVLMVVLGIGVMFLAGVHILYFIGGGVTIAALLPLVWSNLHDYQRKRVEVFLNPEGDPLGAGYHIAQSKIALGSGGLTGRGFMQGTQSQLNFLPEKRTDFIFTMFAEEWGFVGSVMLIALFGLLVFMSLLMAVRCASPFARLIISGTAVMIFIYVFINIAMASGLVPVVGVSLPLVSYGGTSMATIMFSMGLSMCVYVHRGQGFSQSRRRMMFGA